MSRIVSVTLAGLLLAPLALAQDRDGNLIEYGSAAVIEEPVSVWPHLPLRVKIFRDGRLLIIEPSGAWQGRIDSTRIHDLERDLERTPLLQMTRLAELRGRRPIAYGGLSFIRFRDGSDEVILAAPGIPVSPEWKAILDRVNAERPRALTPFRPGQLRFQLWTWTVRLPGASNPWPFTSTIPLAGVGSGTVTTSDPVVIDRVVAQIFDSTTFLHPIEENGVQYGFIFDGAPGWLEDAALKKCLAELWCEAPHDLGFGSDDGNLIEYGRGGFADGGFGGPMLEPPEVKIYADGRIVFRDKNGLRLGHLDPKRLARLERDLTSNPILRESKVLPIRNGGPIGFHGGMAYIRYRNADDEVIVAVLSHPRRGPYVSLLNRIRREIPTSSTSFRPKEIGFRVYAGSTWQEPVDWPFSGALPLAVRGLPTTTTDPAVIAFVLEHSFAGFSWMQTNVRDGGFEFQLVLSSAPDWYEPDALAPTLDDLKRIASTEQDD